jgi:hypothetical protein
VAASSPASRSASPRGVRASTLVLISSLDISLIGRGIGGPRL